MGNSVVQSERDAKEIEICRSRDEKLMKLEGSFATIQEAYQADDSAEFDWMQVLNASKDNAQLKELFEQNELKLALLPEDLRDGPELLSALSRYIRSFQVTLDGTEQLAKALCVVCQGFHSLQRLLQSKVTKIEVVLPVAATEDSEAQLLYALMTNLMETQSSESLVTQVHTYLAGKDIGELQGTALTSHYPALKQALHKQGSPANRCLLSLLLAMSDGEGLLEYLVVQKDTTDCEDELKRLWNFATNPSSVPISQTSQPETAKLPTVLPVTALLYYGCTYTEVVLGSKAFLGVYDSKATDALPVIKLLPSGHIKVRGGGKIESSVGYGEEDKIGILVDLERQVIRFYKNSTKMEMPDIPYPYAKAQVRVTLQAGGSFSLDPGAALPNDISTSWLRNTPSADSSTSKSILQSLQVLAAKDLQTLAGLTAFPKQVFGLTISLSCHSMELLTTLLKAAAENEEIAKLLLPLIDLNLQARGKCASAAIAEPLIQSLKDLSQRDSALGRGCSDVILHNLPLFYSNASARLVALSAAISQPEGILESRLITRFAETSELVGLLQGVTKEEWAAFQVLVIGDSVPSSLAWSYQKSLFYLLHLTPADDFLGSQVALYSNAVLTKLLRGLNNRQLPDLQTDLAESLCLMLTVAKADVNQVAALTPMVLDVLTALQHYQVPNPDVTLTKTTGKLTVPLTPPSSETVLDLPLPAGTTRVLLKIPEHLHIAVRCKGEWVEGLSDLSLPEDLAVKLHSGDAEIAAFDLEWESITAETGKVKAIITKLRLLVSAVSLHHAERLITGSVLTSNEVSSDLSKALDSKLVQSGIKEDAWKLLDFPITLPSALDSLFQVLVEPYEPCEVPTYQRSVSMMTPAQYHSEQTGSEGDLLSGYLHSAAVAVKGTYAYDNSLFLESLIEGKGSAAVLWTRVRKQLGLDKKPASSVGGAEGDRTERAILALLLKALRVVGDVESLPADSDKMPELVPLLWKEALAVRAFLSQKQQDMSELRTNVQQLCVLLLHTDIPAFLTHSGVLTVRKHVDASLPLGLRALKRLGSKAIVEDKTRLEAYKQALTTVSDFIKVGVSVKDFAKAIETRRNQAVSRTLGYALLSLLLKDFQQPCALSTFVRSLSGHYLSGLSGIDPTLRRCLRKQFFTLWEAVLTQASQCLQQKRITLQTCKESILSLQGLVFPLAQYDYATLADKPMRALLSGLLKVAQGQTAVYEEEVEPWLCVSGFDQELKPVYGGKPIVALRVGEDVQGWTKATNGTVTLSYLQGTGDSYLTAMEEGANPVFSPRAMLLGRRNRSQSIISAEKDMKTVAWSVFKHFAYSTAMEKQQGEALESQLVTLLTEQVKKIEVEKGPAAPQQLAEIPSGTAWVTASKEPLASAAALLERASVDKCREVNLLVRTYLYWEDHCAAVTPAAIQVLEGSVELQLWTDSQGKLSLETRLAALKADPKTSDSVKTYLEGAVSPASEIDSQVPVPASLSLLWLLQMSPSWGSQRFLGVAEVKERLLNVAFSPNSLLSSLAFRVLRASFIHSKAAVEFSVVPPVLAAITEGEPVDMSTALLQLVAVPQVSHITWRLQKCSVAKDTVVGFGNEALCFLLSTFESVDCQRALLSKAEEAAKELSQPGNWASLKGQFLTLLGFFALLQGQQSNVLQLLKPVANTNLKGLVTAVADDKVTVLVLETGKFETVNKSDFKERQDTEMSTFLEQPRLLQMLTALLQALPALDKWQASAAEVLAACQFRQILTLKALALIQELTANKGLFEGLNSLFSLLLSKLQSIDALVDKKDPITAPLEDEDAGYLGLEQSSSADLNNLFKLSKAFVLKLVSSSAGLTHATNQYNQHFLRAQGPACLEGYWDTGVFKGASGLEAPVTVLVALGAETGQLKGKMGCKVAGIEIALEAGDKGVTCSYNEHLLFADVPNKLTFCLAVTIHQTGEVSIIAENKQGVCHIPRPGVYQLLSHPFIFFTETAPAIVLRGLSIFEGTISPAISFFKNVETVPETQLVATDPRQVFLKFKLPALGKALGCITGLPDATMEQAASALVEGHCAPQLPPLTISDLVIEDIKLFDSPEQVPSSYTIAEYWKNGQHLGVSTMIPGLKVLAYKCTPLHLALQSVTSFYVKAEAEESPGMITVGNMWLDKDSKACLYVLQKSVLGSLKNKLMSFMLIEAESEEELEIPPGSALVRFLTGKEKAGSVGCPIFNLYPSGSKVLVLAARQYDSLLGFSAQHLHFANNEESEKPPSETAKPEPTTLSQRKAEVYLAGCCREAEMASTVLQTLGLEAPWELAAALQDYALFQQLLFAYRKETASLKTLLKALMGTSSLIQNHVLGHCLWQLMHSLSRPLSLSEQTPIFVESLHPYENNMNYDQSYIIPGALKLYIEFTAQTKTEGNCDVLTFYRGANHQDQICAYSGENSNFKPLEIKGDRVFLHFRSDGSVVYWGYAFTVTPISAVTEAVSSVPRDYQLLKPDLGLWMLEEVCIPPAAKPGISKLLLCLLHFPLSELSTCRLIAVLAKCVAGSEEAPVYLSLLREEAESLWRAGERMETWPKVLPALLALLPLSLLESWAPAFVDLRFSLQSLTLRGSEAEPLLLRHLLQRKSLSLSIVHESTHPYAASTQRHTVSFPGIRHYRIETDEKCQLDLGHDLFVGASFQPESSAPATTDILTPTRILFSRDCAAPTIAVIDDGKAVISSANSWGSAILDKEVGSYQFEITFRVDSSGSDNFGFGVAMHKSKFEVANCGYPGNNLSTELYCYQANGLVNGSNSTEVTIRTGQRITIAMDSKRQITFRNNGVLVGTSAVPKSKKLRIYVTAYGPQKFSIESYKDTSTALAHTRNRVYSLAGEEVCIAYPINKAFLTRYEWHKECSAHPNIATMKTEGWQVCTVSTPMQAGLNVFQVKLVNIDTAEAQVGVIASGEPLDQPMTDTNSYSLSTTGLCYINSQSEAGQRFTSKDLITVIWDLFTYTVRFQVNGQEAYRAQLSQQLGKKQFFFAVAFSHPEQAAEIESAAANPALHTIESTGLPQSWGVKLAVFPEVTGPEGMQVIQQLTEDQKGIWEREKTLQARFSKAADSELVSLLDKQATKASKSPLDLLDSELDLSPEALLLCTELEKFQPADLHKRIALIKDFNYSVDSSIELLDLSDSSSSVQKQLLACKGLLFYWKKSEKLKTVLDQTAGGSTPSIPVNRIRANFLRKKGIKDLNCKISVFAQVMASLNERPEKDLWVSERAFRVELTGEGATDAGGPYNEIISTMCEEIMSDFLPLFLPSPNNSLNTGLFRDAYIPHPDSTSSLHMAMYRFLGILFGIAIRTQNNLALTFPPLFWKRVAQEPVELQDLKGIDENSVKALELLRDPKSQNVSEEDFVQLLTEFTFTTKNSAGREISLVPGGKDTIVTRERAEEYANMIEVLRLNENLEAYEMIRAGLGAIVPLNLLFVMSWSQIETLICGAPEVDVERLKKNTEYEGYSSEDSTILYFWEVMNEMTAEQRSAFLRFAWGRARLPAAGNFRQFKITRYSCENSDQYLPLSHTCFFTIDLPPYSSKEVLRNKLMYALTHCQSIDNDHDGGNWDVEE